MSEISGFNLYLHFITQHQDKIYFHLDIISIFMCNRKPREKTFEKIYIKLIENSSQVEMKLKSSKK